GQTDLNWDSYRFNPNLKKRCLQRMHRHGTTRTCFKTHSVKPCLLERRMSVEPQTAHRKRLSSRACSLRIGSPVAASSRCLCADIFDELPDGQGTAFRATNKSLALDEGHLTRTAFRVIKSSKVCGRSSFHGHFPLFSIMLRIIAQSQRMFGYFAFRM